MGAHWLPDLSDLSAIGHLVNRAKDLADADAADELCEMLGEFARHEPLLAGHPSRSGDATIVVPVPPNPTARDHLAPRLATAVATALDLPVDHELAIRRHPTRRLRDTEVSQRQVTAERAGYEVTRPMEGANVVLVDDVVMTGTTLGHLAEILTRAGAARIDAVVATRTTRRSTA